MAKKLEIKELNIEHLSAVMELQKKVIGDLHEDEKHFVLTRSAQDFIKAFPWYMSCGIDRCMYVVFFTHF